MAPNDLTLLVAYVVGLIGDIFTAVGGVFIANAADPMKMNMLTVGIFGEYGGLIFWCNEKLLWMLEQIISGLWFTVVG